MFGLMEFCCGKLCRMANDHTGTGEITRYDILFDISQHLVLFSWCCLLCYGNNEESVF